MNPATFRCHLSTLSTKVFGVSLCRLAAYILLAASLWVLLHRFCPEPLLAILAIPILAELALILRMGKSISLLRGLVTRFTGLVLALALYFYLYLVPFVYTTKKPYPEEYAWMFFTIVMQCIVVIVVTFVKKIISRFLTKCHNLTF